MSGGQGDTRRRHSTHRRIGRAAHPPWAVACGLQPDRVGHLRRGVAAGLNRCTARSRVPGTPPPAEACTAVESLEAAGGAQPSEGSANPLASPRSARRRRSGTRSKFQTESDLGCATACCGRCVVRGVDRDTGGHRVPRFRLRTGWRGCWSRLALVAAEAARSVWILILKGWCGPADSNRSSRPMAWWRQASPWPRVSALSFCGQVAMPSTQRSPWQPP